MNAQINLDSGLVGYFALDGTPGDSSPIGINGIINNTSLTVGKTNNIDSAFYFNGVDAYVNCDTINRGITDVVTLSVWVKTIDTGYQVVVGKLDWTVGYGYRLSISNGLVAVSGKNNGIDYVTTHLVNSSNLVNDGNWHHIVGIIDGNNWECWVDCTLENRVVSSSISPSLSSLDPLTIGNYFRNGTGNNSDYFEGSIDEVRIYNRVLTSSEMQLLCDINYIDPVIATPIAPSDTIVCENTAVTFQAFRDTGTVYWINEQGLILDSGTSVAITVSADTRIVLYNEVNGQKSDTVSFFITVTQCGDEIFPNVFTPNGDGINDYFYFTIPNVTCFSGRIYNRWGVLVYNMPDIEFAWDGIIQYSGEQVPDGVYYYVVTYCVNGEEQKTETGSFSIIR